MPSIEKIFSFLKRKKPKGDNLEEAKRIRDEIQVLHKKMSESTSISEVDELIAQSQVLGKKLSELEEK